MDLVLLQKGLYGIFFAITVAIVISKLRGKKYKLPPGPISVPIFGNWLQVGDDLNHRNLTELAKKYGEIFLLRMGQRNLVVVSSPDLAKEVLHTQGVEFGSRTRNVVFDIFTGIRERPGHGFHRLQRALEEDAADHDGAVLHEQGCAAVPARVGVGGRGGCGGCEEESGVGDQGIVLRRRLQLISEALPFSKSLKRRFLLLSLSFRTYCLTQKRLFSCYVVQNGLISMYCRFGLLTSVESLLDRGDGS